MGSEVKVIFMGLNIYEKRYGYGVKDILTLIIIKYLMREYRILGLFIVQKNIFETERNDQRCYNSYNPMRSVTFHSPIKLRIKL